MHCSAHLLCAISYNFPFSSPCIYLPTSLFNFPMHFAMRFSVYFPCAISRCISLCNSLCFPCAVSLGILQCISLRTFHVQFPYAIRYAFLCALSLCNRPMHFAMAFSVHFPCAISSCISLCVSRCTFPVQVPSAFCSAFLCALCLCNFPVHFATHFSVHFSLCLSLCSFPVQIPYVFRYALLGAVDLRETQHMGVSILRRRPKWLRFSCRCPIETTKEKWGSHFSEVDQEACLLFGCGSLES